MESKRKLSNFPQILKEEFNADCLPACRVCNGPGNGLHYGVNTCDACKGFFHRTIKLHLEYTCKEDSTCRIQYGRGKMCQHCRYQKCISVGMSRLAIKTGRYTLSRKADCILEVKKQEMMARCSNQSSPESDDLPTYKPDVSLTGDWSNTPFHKEKATRGFSHYREDNLTQGSPPDYNDHLSKSSPLFHEDHLTSISIQDDSCMPPSLTPVPSVESVNTSYSTTSLSPGFDATSSSDPTALLPNIPDSFSSLSQSSETMSLTNPSTPATLIASNSGPGSNSSNSMTACSLSSTNPSAENVTDPRTTKEDSDYASVSSSVEDDGNPISNLYLHKDVVLQRLLEAHLVSFQACRWTREELSKQAIEHYEACKMKEEMFGKLQILSEEEYDEVKTQTGIDADGRAEFLSRFLDGMESLVYAMVRFAKVVPGFVSLDMEDQINLVKHNRLEFNLITNYTFSNVELGVISCQNDKWVCVNEAMSSDLQWAGKEYISIQDQLQKLNLTEEEQAVLKAISALTPDRTPLTNKSSIHEIYRNLTDILIFCLKKRHKNPHQIFGDIMKILTNFKQVEGRIKESIATLNIPKYSGLHGRPLLGELVTDFYISTSGT